LQIRARRKYRSKRDFIGDMGLLPGNHLQAATIERESVLDRSA